MHFVKIKQRLSRLNLKEYVLLFCCMSPVMSIASPWVEASDPFLRSSLVLLSDSGQISSPVNQYPIRWSLFGDDLKPSIANFSEDAFLEIAQQELLYTLNTARLNRGNRLFKIINSANRPLLTGFGQENEDDWGVYTSFENLSGDFSYRLSVGYSEYADDDGFNWDDSYLSLNNGQWLFTLGNIDRWWGQGWQHNLILGSYAKAVPDMSVSYIGENSVMGVWSVETLLASPDNKNIDHHSATRLTSKPFRHFEYGITYQTWFSEIDSSGKDEQLALDAKLILPSFLNVYHNVYAEIASTDKMSETGAWLIGWTGSFPIAEHTARLVIESQQLTKSNGVDRWHLGQYPSVSEGVANTSYLLDDSLSLAFYLQLSNDHKLSVSYQTSMLRGQTINTSQFTYYLPALAGMVYVGAGIDQVSGTGSVKDQTSLSTGYSFRF